MATMIPCPECGIPYDDDTPNPWACHSCVVGPSLDDDGFIRLRSDPRPSRLNAPPPAPPKRRGEWWRR
jgi:hypothetical protein